jgi:N-acetylneuraminic acid mutarotase
MPYHFSPQAVLVLGSFWLAACADNATEPSSTPQSDAAVSAAATSGSWLVRANMPANRSGPATAVLRNAAGQDVVYTIGGLNPNRVPVRTVTAYNVATNSWTFRHQLPLPLAATNGAGVLNGKIYVTGGYGDYSGNYPGRTVYMYDPASNTWTRNQDMPTIDLGYGDREYPGGGGVTGVISGKLYVVSGAFRANEPWGYQEAYHSLFFRYNPATDRWTRLPAPFAGTATISPYVGGVIGGKLYVMAGSPYTHDAYFEAYDPATNQWVPRTPLGVSRPGAAAAVQDAKLFLFGGTRYDAARDAMETLDITIAYDPVTDAWTRRASMPSPRSGMEAVKVFVAGKPRVEVVGGNAPAPHGVYNALRPPVAMKTRALPSSVTRVAEPKSPGAARAFHRLVFGL